MQISNELRVGIMFLTGLILLVLLIVSLTRWGQDRNTYNFTIRFKQAQGIQEGAAVRVAGVVVGRISNISLDPLTNEALLNVRVSRDVAVYANYCYTIGMGGLVGERFVEILPAIRDTGPQIPPGGEVPGTTTPDINEVISGANTLVQKLTVTVDSLNAVVGNRESQRNLQIAIANLKRASESSASMTARLDALVLRNEGSLDLVAANLEDVSSDLRRVSDALTPQLENTNIIRNLDEASANAVKITQRLADLSNVVNEMLGDKEIKESLREALAHLKQSSSDLEAVLANARVASSSLPRVAANLELASADLPKITGPFREVAPETAQNLRTLSGNLRATSEDIGGIARQVGRVSSLLRETRFEPEARLLGVSRGNEHYRSDLNMNIYSGTGLFRAGVGDIGGDSGINLQLGSRLGHAGWLRYGVVQSRFGLGVDYQMGSAIRFSGELFDPNHPRANALLDFHAAPLGDDLWLTSGWYNIFSKRHTFGVGLTYRP